MSTHKCCVYTPTHTHIPASAHISAYSKYCQVATFDDNVYTFKITLKKEKMKSQMCRRLELREAAALTAIEKK